MSNQQQQDPTASLKRKASRWQILPESGAEASKDINVDDKKYSLLLFLRDLDIGQNNWNDFIQGLQNAPGAIDENSTMGKLLAAALETQRIQFDYIDPGAPNAKKRRLGLYGNGAAGQQIQEYDALITMARAVWKDPNDLKNYVGKAYRDNLRPLAEGDKQRYSMDTIFDYARSWSEVRYRFMNHSLRDDPSLHNKYNNGRISNKGNGANTMVHESNLLLDARMVEFQLIRGTGYNPQDRVIYEELYLMTPEEGRELIRYTSNQSGLRIGLPGVFRYCVSYINAYLNWRVRVLESARKQALATPAYRNANTYNQRQGLRDAANRTIFGRINPVDDEYTKFVEALRALLVDARTHNAFQRASYDEIDAAVTRLGAAVRACPINRSSPDLQHNVRFQNELAAFPGLQIALSRPTGSSIIPTPRRRP
ncbi:hypothetical protein F4859DRAFT_263097 [Xylaria cf. heliscus]|nr:hypothetical protein F4859DRAFT_263097 [Xylaria cf. heliscus]